MRRFFVLYRRGDSDQAAEAIYRALCQRFGSWRVRVASDDEHIRRAGWDVARLHRQCAALVLVMGRHWTSSSAWSGAGIGAGGGAGTGASVQEASGERHLDNARDLQRQIVEGALRAPSILVLPVLVDDAAMPSPLELPPPLADLAYRNAAVAPPGPAFPAAVQRIVRGILTWLPYHERVTYPQYAVSSLLVYLVSLVAFYAGISLLGGFNQYLKVMPESPTNPAVLHAQLTILTPLCGVLLADMVLSVITLIRAIHVRSWPWALGILAGMLLGGPLVPLFFGVFGRAEPPPHPAVVPYVVPVAPSHPVVR